MLVEVEVVMMTWVRVGENGMSSRVSIVTLRALNATTTGQPSEAAGTGRSSIELEQVLVEVSVKQMILQPVLGFLPTRYTFNLWVSSPRIPAIAAPPIFFDVESR